THHNTMTKHCCCGVFSITTGAQILAALMVLGAVGSIVSVCVPNAKHTPATRIGTGLSSAVELIAGVLVFLAIRKERAVLMTPILAYAGISLFCIAIAFILCVYGLFDQHSVVPNWIRFLLEHKDEITVATTEEPINPEQYVFVLTVVFTLFAAIAFAFSVWYFSVFHNCFKHLKELERCILAFPTNNWNRFSTRGYGLYQA
ncbi:hypothetical protein PMAYCL1PPCAC_15281, partial [Pristionchus mayeri]